MEFEFLRAGNSEATEKKALNALFASTSGVLSGLVVTQTTTASGSVLIASGSALVHPSAVSASLLGNDTQKTLDVFTLNPVGGLPRNDIVEFDQITAAIIVHVGVPNATPTDPTVPATSVALARLRHAASALDIPTAKIDTLIVNTTLRGVSVQTSYTPTLTQGVGRGVTVNYAKYAVNAKTCSGTVQMTSTGANSGGSAITIPPPLTAAVDAIAVGTFTFFIAATSARRAGTVFLLGGLLYMLVDNTVNNFFGGLPSYGLAVGDQLTMSFQYEIP
jgi:hypothetical protein